MQHSSHGIADLKVQGEATESLEKDGSEEQAATFSQMVLQASAYSFKAPALK